MIRAWRWFELVFYSAALVVWWALPILPSEFTPGGAIQSPVFRVRMLGYFMWFSIGAVLTWVLIYGCYLKFKGDPAE